MANDLIDVEANKTIAEAFKIYVYDVREYEELHTLTKGASFCKDNQWGFEVWRFSENFLPFVSLRPLEGRATQRSGELFSEPSSGRQISEI